MGKQQLVVDTSVCIDIFNGGIINEVVELPCLFLLPDVILVEELKDPPGTVFTGEGFISISATGDEVQTIERLSGKYKRPSRNDLFALAIAKVRRLVLLSGDKDLRNAARREKVVVHGTIWVLDQLVSQSIISETSAADALDKILKAGARLPEKECAERLKRWRN